MKTAAIYARYSTNLQNESSIEDQVATCRAYASREGLKVIRVFSDSAISGASLGNRPGASEMLAAAQAHQFEAIIVYDLARLSRDMEDLAGIFKRLSHEGISLLAVNEGEATTVLVGLRGFIGQLYREDNANRIRHAGEYRVQRGLAGGSLTYGYAAVSGEPGKRVVVEHEAEIVRRIMKEYVAGATPRDISAALNKDGIPAPRGKLWAASAINGMAKRGTGILNNELYAGRMVWNRNRMLKHPDTGRRISRQNPPDQWVRKDVPDLAIVTPELFEAVQERRTARGFTPAHKQRRPRHVLSGLLRCAACGGGMAVQGADKSGRKRLYCSTHRESNSCPAPQTFYLDTVERVVLDRLQEEFRKPVVISEYVKEYHEERRRLATKANKRRPVIERRLGEIRREEDRTMDIMVATPKGTDVSTWQERLNELSAERRNLEAELAVQPEAPKQVTILHPAVLARYEKQLEALQAATAKGMSDGDSTAAEAMRELVESVIVRRGEQPGTVAVEIRGRLEALIGPDGQRRVSNVRGAFQSAGKVVAEDGFEPPTHGL